MKNTLKIGFLAMLFAVVFVACKPKTEEAVDAAAEEVATEATDAVEQVVDSAAAAVTEAVDTAAAAATN